MRFERDQLFSYVLIMMCVPLVCYYKQSVFENDQGSRSCSLCKLNSWVSLLICKEFLIYREVTKKKVDISQERELGICCRLLLLKSAVLFKMLQRKLTLTVISRKLVISM
jgi:hypothetical protein